MGSGALGGPAASNGGYQNTAVGAGGYTPIRAVSSTPPPAHTPANTTGGDNTACGASALIVNTTGSSNTATGFAALYANTTGYNKTVSGRARIAVIVFLMTSKCAVRSCVVTSSTTQCQPTSRVWPRSATT
jgi:hypothetical protein